MSARTWLIIGALLVAGLARADDSSSDNRTSAVPATVEDGAHTFTQGGKQIGEGFRGIGRGIKDVFTGLRSKEDFEDAKKIGTGTRDLGLGTAGIGRGVGRVIKKETIFLMSGKW